MNIYSGHFCSSTVWENFVSGSVIAAAGTILGTVLIALAFAVAARVVMYVFRAVGLQTVAKRRGIRHSWLAWIPVVNLWILGSISDRYQYVTKGKSHSARKVLLGLGIVNACVSAVPAYVGICNALIPRFQAPAASIPFSIVSSKLSASGLAPLCSIAGVVIAIVLAVCSYIALYRYYASCAPKFAAVKLVLSVLCPFTAPFFIFFSRKKDLGMCPQAETPAAEEAAEETE